MSFFEKYFDLTAALKTAMHAAVLEFAEEFRDQRGEKTLAGHVSSCDYARISYEFPTVTTAGDTVTFDGTALVTVSNSNNVTDDYYVGDMASAMICQQNNNLLPNGPIVSVFLKIDNGNIDSATITTPEETIEVLRLNEPSV